MWLTFGRQKEVVHTIFEIAKKLHCPTLQQMILKKFLSCPSITSLLYNKIDPQGGHRISSQKFPHAACSTHTHFSIAQKVVAGDHRSKVFGRSTDPDIIYRLDQRKQHQLIEPARSRPTCKLYALVSPIFLPCMSLPIPLPRHVWAKSCWVGMSLHTLSFVHTLDHNHELGFQAFSQMTPNRDGRICLSSRLNKYNILTQATDIQRFNRWQRRIGTASLDVRI